MSLSLGKPIVVSFPQNGDYRIDREELLRLAQRKVLNIPAYIYFALALDYPNGAEGLHFETFCERWAISEPDAIKAIATLEKKGVLTQKHQQLCFQFVYEEEE